MAKSKWFEIESKLTLIEGWARNGLTDEQIARNLNISKTTFYKYRDEHTELSELLKKSKEKVDFEVENALLKKALGYSYEEKTYETVFNPDLGKYVETLTKRVTKQVSPDTTAQIFWLKNRKAKEWREKQEIENNVNGNINITIDKKVEELSQ